METGWQLQMINIVCSDLLKFLMAANTLPVTDQCMILHRVLKTDLHVTPMLCNSLDIGIIPHLCNYTKNMLESHEMHFSKSTNHLGIGATVVCLLNLCNAH